MRAIAAGYVVKTSKIVPQGLLHAREHAVFVQLDSGFMAWGFHTDRQTAETLAVAAAKSVEESVAE